MRQVLEERGLALPVKETPISASVEATDAVNNDQVGRIHNSIICYC